MNVLAIETSGTVGSVAACCDADVVAEQMIDNAMDHGRMLLPLVDRVVRIAGWDKRRDIELVAVSHGPGSFTGLRVGIACAKTLAVLLHIPLVAVCSLDAIAENAPPDAERILTVLDAKRGQVYAAAYERRAGALARIWGPELLDPADAMRRCTRPCLVMGTGLEPHHEAFAGAREAEKDLWRPRASTVARIGLSLFRTGQRFDPLTVHPLYLRLAEAEEKRIARERGRA